MKNLFVWIVAVLFFAGLFLVGHIARGDDLTDLTRQLEQKTAARKVDPFSPSNTKDVCGCQGPDSCSCDRCGCKACAAPRIGSQKITDDSSRPWTYDYGDRYGFPHELGWYRPAREAVRHSTPMLTFSGFASGNCSSGR